MEVSTANVPRNSSGAHSDMYMGTVLVASPDAKPTNKRPTNRHGMEFSERQLKNNTAPIVNKIPVVNNAPFLQITKNAHTNK